MNTQNLVRLQSLWLLWQSLKPRRQRQLLWMQGLSLVAAASEVANLGALLPLLQLLANPTKGITILGPFAVPLRGLSQQYLLLTLGLGFIFVVVVSTALRVLTIYSQLRLSALITADLGEQVFSAVLERPYIWHLRINSSAVLSYLTRDVEAVFGSVQALLLLVMNIVIVIFLGGSLFIFAPEVMFSVGTILSAFYLLVFRLTRASLRSDGDIALREHQHTLQMAQEGLGGIRDILLDRSQETFLHAYRQSNKRQKLAGASVNIKAQVPRYLIEGFTIIIVVGVSLTLSFQGHGIQKQLPLLGTLTLGVYRLLQPLQQCFGAVSSLQANLVALKRLESFLVAKPTSVSTLDDLRPSLMEVSNSIFNSRTIQPLSQLKNVSFRYTDDGPWVLRDLNLSIQPGERLAFVGTTGSGKSTTSDLILGLLEPTEGQLLVAGHDLHATPNLVAAWQQRVAHVPQHIYLTDDSFSANIAFGVPTDRIDVNRVKKAAEQACIAGLIEASSDGYRTVVGERGVRLSGGQRQRIGIARALYKQAQLLVLDEATSALDVRTEAEVISAIESLDRNLTIILIAHRLTTVKGCDRIVQFDNGRISAIGTFSELSLHPAFQALTQHRSF
jgi:ABC-type multidrug transport system fused ATPase/permease subunit